MANKLFAKLNFTQVIKILGKRLLVFTKLFQIFHTVSKKFGSVKGCQSRHGFQEKNYRQCTEN